MIIVIDNYDSFTYNLVHYIGEFEQDIKVIRNDEMSVTEIMDNNPSKIVISPGPCTPKEAGISVELIKTAEVPILGVCLGHQAIAEFYGCKLLNLTDSMHAISSELKHLNNCSLFENLPDNFKIGHYHSWVIDNVDFSERLEITSINEDGLIMSIKHKKYNIKAVQFHPESILTEYGLELIRNWLLN